MDTVLELFNIDWKTVVVGIIVILFAVVALVQVIGKFSEIIGKPLKWVQKNNKDHETLERLITVVDGLEKKHTADTEAFTTYNADFEQKFEDFMIEMRGQMQGYLDARVHDREQSREIQKELLTTQQEQSDAISEVSNVLKALSMQINLLQESTGEHFMESENKENKRVQAEIKNTIAQLYRGYHESQQFTAMEKEALEDLIDSYENHGGDNSFIHSLVQQEMYTWKVIN